MNLLFDLLLGGPGRSSRYSPAENKILVVLGGLAAVMVVVVHWLGWFKTEKVRPLDAEERPSEPETLGQPPRDGDQDRGQ